MGRAVWWGLSFLLILSFATAGNLEVWTQQYFNWSEDTDTAAPLFLWFLRFKPCRLSSRPYALLSLLQCSSPFFFPSGWDFAGASSKCGGGRRWRLCTQRGECAVMDCRLFSWGRPWAHWERVSTRRSRSEAFSRREDREPELELGNPGFTK